MARVCHSATLSRTNYGIRCRGAKPQATDRRHRPGVGVRCGAVSGVLPL